MFMTVLEALSPWCLAGCTAMKNKSYNYKMKFLSFYKSLGITAQQSVAMAWWDLNKTTLHTSKVNPISGGVENIH